MMVNFFSIFVSCNATATVSQVADHVEHIKKIAGARHIGVGADFDGKCERINCMAQSCLSLSSWPKAPLFVVMAGTFGVHGV